jgi:cobaltochelatase CobN
MLAAATSKRDGAIVSIPEQVDAVAGKAVARAVQSTPNAGSAWPSCSTTTRPAKNLSASFLNLPRSLAKYACCIAGDEAIAQTHR